MSEEEKKAIEELKSKRDYFKWQPEGCNWRLSFDEEEVKTIIDVVLNLIEKKQKEIEELKEEQSKRSWVHIKENGEVEPLFYISKDKIKKIINKYVNIEEHLKFTNQELFGEDLKNMIKELLEE